MLWFETYLACFPPLSHTGPTCHPGTSSGADQLEPRPRRRYSGRWDPEHWCWSSERGTSSWGSTGGRCLCETAALTRPRRRGEITAPEADDESEEGHKLKDIRRCSCSVWWDIISLHTLTRGSFKLLHFGDVKRWISKLVTVLYLITLCIFIRHFILPSYKNDKYFHWGVRLLPLILLQ